MNRITTPLKAAFCFSLLLVSSWALYAQKRGLAVEAAADLGSSVGKQWAVFIAIDRYREWNPLKNPVRDAKEIKKILQENYYIDEVRELYDQQATAAGIRQLMVDMRSQVGKDDSVFVFYAGHGYTDPYTNTGFWIPVDGGQDQMAQANWVPNIQIRNMLSQLSAKHVFLISDSCFSGDLLDTNRGAPSRIDSNYYRQAYGKVSRQVMTSGASESVPDASEFAGRLKSTLQHAESAYVDPEYLFTIVREVRQTQPMLGAIIGNEHQRGGSFLFFRKQEAGALSAIVTPPVLSAAMGSIVVTSEIAGIILVDGEDTGSRIKIGGSVTIANVQTGETEVAVKAINGKITQAPQPVMVTEGEAASVEIARPAPMPLTGMKAPAEDKPARLWSVGAETGTSFATPLFIGTVHGTIAPFNHSFLEMGVDFGMGSGYDDVEYYSFYPFAHYALFAPFENGGWYAGAGGGYMLATYTFSYPDTPQGEKVADNTFGVDFCTGVIIANIFTITYTLRTNFSSADNKVAVGIIKRF